MTLPRTVVDISETDTEYLLSIHASLRDRAKTIPGYRWDTQRVRWVYPRTARVYDALIAEFGDDVVGALKVTRPGKTSAQPTAELQAENQALKEQVGKIRETLEVISGATANGQSSQVQALQAALAAKEGELAEVKRRADDAERRLAESAATKKELSSEVEKLQGMIVTLRGEVAKKAPPTPDLAVLFEQMLRERAKEATGRDIKFSSLVDRLKLNESLPIDLVKELGRELRHLVNCEDRGISLHDLLMQARDAGVLTERGIDLAHLIRKQRNVMAHENTDKRTHQAQILLCLFAAALLWPEFAG